MEGLKNWCRLCGDAVNDKSFKVIDEVVKQNLDFLLLNLNIDDKAQHVICGSCSAKLLEALTFKSICLHTDNAIMPYVDFDEPQPVDLKYIYFKEKGNVTLDKLEVCRLCMQPVDGEYISLQKIPIEFIQTYIPELNFKVTTDPVVCVKCYNSVLTSGGFIRSCLDVEKNLNKANVMENVMLSTDEHIKSEEIEIKTEEENDENEKLLMTTQSVDIKLDEAEGASNISSISLFTCDKCKYETKHRNCLKKHMLKHKDPSEVQMHKCDKCKFETKYKNGLKSHMLIHKDSSQVQMHKCDKCKYETKYKSHLNSHMLVHKDISEVQVNKCDKCKYETKYKQDLKYHMLRHKNLSELQMYKCVQCKFETKYKGALKHHILRHKDPSEVQMHKCDKCKFETKERSYLKKHMLKHKDPSEVQMHKCGKCKFETKHKQNLNTHKLIHKDSSELHMHECNKCKFASKRKKSLKKHMLTHKYP